MQYLSEQEKINIAKVIAYNSDLYNYKDYNLTNLLDQWSSNKERFIKLFGGLIYTCKEKRKYELSSYQKSNYFDEFITKLEETFIYADVSIPHDEIRQIISFLQKNGSEAFFKNTIGFNYIENSQIKKGMKLLKSLKFFIKDNILLSKVQDLASRYIQLNKLEGILCLSVHPLDFLSSSENCSKWRSCHALDGEYRGGNLSYMVDDCTIIAYIKSEDGEIHHLPNFPNDVTWNNKKWRRLFHFSSDWSYVFAGRPYPYNLKNILSYMSKTVFPAIGINNFQTGEWIKEDAKLIKLVCKGAHALNYNDILDSTVYKPYSILADNVTYEQQKPILTIGAGAMCPLCGKHILDWEDSLTCSYCDEDHYGHCSYCDSREPIDSLYTYIDTYGDERVCCEYCFNRYVIQCPACGGFYDIDCMEYDEKNDRHICHNCASYEGD